MNEHRLREQVSSGVWTPRLIFAEAVYVSAKSLQDYLIYRSLSDGADGLGFGEIGCMCIGFRMAQLRGNPATCKHVKRFKEEEAS